MLKRVAAVGWMTMAVTLAAPSAAAVSVIVPDASYPEGPLWSGGRLFYVEYGNDDVKVWNGKASSVFWKQAHCGPSGLIEHRPGRLLVACYDANSLVELDAGGQVLRTFDKDDHGKPFIGPNDFARDAHGGLYFSASGVYDLAAPITGTVLYMNPAGQITEVANTIHYSNGLTLSKDGQTLLVAEGLAGRILAFPVKSDASLGLRTVWARLRDLAPATAHEDAYNGPDGLKLGPDGNYYIAQNGSGRVLIVGSDKQLVRILTVATPYVTNLAFGSDGADPVYITGVFEPNKAPYPGAVYRVDP